MAGSGGVDVGGDVASLNVEDTTTTNNNNTNNNNGRATPTVGEGAAAAAARASFATARGFEVLHEHQPKVGRSKFKVGLLVDC